jgi:hypothetical protein
MLPLRVRLDGVPDIHDVHFERVVVNDTGSK